MNMQEIEPLDEIIETNSAQNSLPSNFYHETSVKFVYNVSPASRDFITKTGIPNAVHYTPFDENIEAQRIKNIEGIICTKCQACINCYSEVLESKQSWICNICNQPNKFSKQLPKAYKSSPTYEIQLTPQPIIPQNSQQHASKAPNQLIYIFVVDLCMPEKQLQSIKQSMIDFAVQKSKNINYLQHTQIRIGLITFSKFVYFYEFNSDINTVVSFGAKKSYDFQEISELLGLLKEQPHYGFYSHRYLQLCKKHFFRVSNQQARERFINRVQKIKAQGEVMATQSKRGRSLRSSGQALNIAISLGEFIPFQTRIVTFLGGPCTHGVGKIIGPEFTEQSRSIHEVDTNPDDLPHFDNARKFYVKLKQKVLGRGIITDFFLFSLEQTGITEMYELIRVSGGYLVLGEEFSQPDGIFQNSFKKAYITLQQTEQNAQQDIYSLTDVSGTSAIMSVICSRDIAINGALGQCHPLKNFGPGNKNLPAFISERSTGFGKANSWYLGSLDMYRCITVAYQCAAPKALDKDYIIQFKTFYTDIYGRKILRVTTAKRSWSNEVESVGQYFDQEAAMLFLARLYIYRQMYDIKRNNKQWLDKTLISWAQMFAKYTKGDSQSFKLPSNMKYLPQFVYNFRRNSIFKRSGIALDQLYYQMHILTRSTVNQCITIIQPALLSYSIDQLQPKAVQLDPRQMKESVILLLDTFFNVILWYGDNIKYWQEEGYHKKKQYENVDKLLKSPEQDINYLLNSRFPYPRLYRTTSNSSKERFLKSKVNPVKESQQNQNMLTDDSSLETFTAALIGIVVKAKV